MHPQRLWHLTELRRLQQGPDTGWSLAAARRAALNTALVARPVPGDSGGGGLAIGSPRFPEAAVRLAGGRRLRILAPAASAGASYVHGLRLDGNV